MNHLTLSTTTQRHDQDPSEYTPRPTGLSRPLNHQEQEKLDYLDRLKFFLATAPSHWDNTDPATSTTSTYSPHPLLHRFPLPSSEFVTCVLWGGLYHISGTDIVRALTFRFEAFGRPVRNVKKFEEGVFSDLRNLKPGVDACLEEPKSPFLDLLFKYQCIRTQKKQKVFYWFSVPHDRLFLDALERDLKREKAGLEPTTVVSGEPALSFTYDPKRSLYEQFSKAGGSRDGESELEAAVRRVEEAEGTSEGDIDEPEVPEESSDEDIDGLSRSRSTSSDPRPRTLPPALQGPNAPFFSFSLFEGSPTYKQRRKKGGKVGLSALGGVRKASAGEEQERGRRFFDDANMGLGDPNEIADVDSMSAAEMFRKQARGELVPASASDRRRLVDATASRAASAAYPMIPTPMHLQNHIMQGNRPRSYDAMQRTAYPISSDLNVPISAPYSTQTFEQAQEQQQLYNDLSLGNDFVSGSPSSGESGSTAPILRSKAFVCPLFSCGRLFKRMEHLKRHLRTHTMERPYECPTCYKKFSRSDNLNQHVRTHGRAGSGSSNTSGSMMGLGPNGEWEWDSDADGVHCTGLESESDEGSLAHALRGPNGEDLGFGSSFPAGLGIEGMADAGLCEVEVRGGVLQDVRGDEEGLMIVPGSDAVVVPHHPAFAAITQEQMFFASGEAAAAANADTGNAGPDPTSQFIDAPQPIMASQDAPWPSVHPHSYPHHPRHSHSLPHSHSHSLPHQHALSLSQASPLSFGAISAPSSPPAGSVPSIRSGQSSLTSSPGSYLRQHSPALFGNGPTHNGVNGTEAGTSINANGDYITSVSAPSHKLAFDHTGMYAPANILGLAHGVDSGNGPGPIRRHRSMTPSLMRGVETVRRPGTSAGEFGANGAASGSNAGVMGLGLGFGGSNSAGAARGYHPYANAMAYGHAQSRAASAQSSPSTYPVQLVHEDVGANPNPHPRALAMGDQFATGSVPFGDVYRTESPVPFMTSPFGGSTTGSGNGNGSSPGHYGTFGAGGQTPPPPPPSAASSASTTGMFGVDVSQGQYYGATAVHPQHVTM